MSDRQPSDAIPATPDPRAEAERLAMLSAMICECYQGAGVVKLTCSAHKRQEDAILAALTAKDEELRSLREASAAIVEDLTEALSPAKPGKRGICSSCGTDHDNENASQSCGMGRIASAPA